MQSKWATPASYRPILLYGGRAAVGYTLASEGVLEDTRVLKEVSKILHYFCGSCALAQEAMVYVHMQV